MLPSLEVVLDLCVGGPPLSQVRGGNSSLTYCLFGFEDCLPTPWSGCQRRLFAEFAIVHFHFVILDIAWPVDTSVCTSVLQNKNIAIFGLASVSRLSIHETTVA